MEKESEEEPGMHSIKLKSTRMKYDYIIYLQQKSMYFDRYRAIITEKKGLSVTMRSRSKRILSILMSIWMVLCYVPCIANADSEGSASATLQGEENQNQESNEASKTYTPEDYANAQKELAQAKANQANGPILFLDSLMSNKTYYIENQINLISKTSDKTIKESYNKYGSKYKAQFTFSNLERQATLLNELNNDRANDDNFKGAANRSALKLNPELIGIAMMSAAISSNKIGHVLFMTTDDNLINDGYGENLSWDYADPLQGWYNEEKKIYDKNGSTGSTGHYELCMGAWNNGGTGVVGFGMTNFGLYGGCDALRLSTIGGEAGFKSYTADEWLQAMNAYKSDLSAKVQNAQSKLDEIKESMEENGQIITKVSISAKKYTYDGKVKKPSVKVYNNKGNLLSTGYTVSIPSAKNLGSYTVKVAGTGEYSGSVSATYVITPAKMAKPTVKASKKKVTIKWKKLGGGSQTYQIAIKRLSPAGKKGTGWKYYTSTGSSRTIKNLKSKKKYTVKIRSYKKISGKTYYGTWSSSKTVKVK